MALIDLLPDNVIHEVIKYMSEQGIDKYSTYDFIEYGYKMSSTINYHDCADAFNEIRNSTRQWKPVVGKALKRYRDQTYGIEKLTNVKQSPANWQITLENYQLSSYGIGCTIMIVIAILIVIAIGIMLIK